MHVFIRFTVNLHRHLQTHGVDYLQFSFRWMNNLLTRELPLHCTIRLWDTYLAESDGFALFHLYVCAAFLLHWKEQLMQQNDFQVSPHPPPSLSPSPFHDLKLIKILFRVSCCCYKICQPIIGPIAK